MFAVIFVVQPKAERWDDYLALAKKLRPSLEAMEGFIDNERFESRQARGRLLSLSTWRDEKALVRWRTHGEHHRVQEKGRFEVFEDYHLRVGEVTLDSGGAGGAPIAPTRLDETMAGRAKAVTITEIEPGQEEGAGMQPGTLAADLGLEADGDGLVEIETFESIYSRGKYLVLCGWRDAAAAARWRPAQPVPGKMRHRQVRVIRDYGMFDRREAPQFFPGLRT